MQELGHETTPSISNDSIVHVRELYAYWKTLNKQISRNSLNHPKKDRLQNAEKIQCIKTDSLIWPKTLHVNLNPETLREGRVRRPVLIPVQLLQKRN